jgi:hypothetical protein
MGIKASQELLEHIKKRKDEAMQVADASYDRGHETSATFWRGYKYSLESLLNELTLDIKESSRLTYTIWSDYGTWEGWSPEDFSTK